MNYKNTDNKTDERHIFTNTLPQNVLLSVYMLDGTTTGLQNIQWMERVVY